MATNPEQGLASPSLSNTMRTPRPVKVVETVSSDGVWCCMARPSSSSSSMSTSLASSPTSSNISSASYSSSSRIANRACRSSRNNSTNGTNHELAKKNGLDKKASKKKSSSLVVVERGGGSGSSNNGSPFRIRLSPGRVSPLIEAPSVLGNNTTPVIANNTTPSIAGNTTIDPNTTGFPNHSSPPPLPPSLASTIEKTRASPTLFEMMVNEHEVQENTTRSHSPRVQSKLEQLLLPGANSPGSLFNDPSSSDAKLILTNSCGRRISSSSCNGSKDIYSTGCGSSNKRDIVSVSLYVHAHIISSHSPVLSAQLASGHSVVQISDCEDVEAYIETLRLMYCQDMKRKLLRESVPRVLSILKVSAAISFEAGVLSCLEYLEAVPWAEDEEEKVASLLSQLRLENTGGACEVLKRLSTDDFTGAKDVLVRLLHLVTKGTDEKARREMKRLVSRMLRENASQAKNQNDLSKESLYQACHRCLDSLFHFYIQATMTSSDTIVQDKSILTAQIVRQADNLNWLVDILIDRHIADEFVRIWAYQDELVLLHAKVPIALGKYEVSRLTARLCVALGQGQVLAPKETRFTLLHNWLQPLIDDFGWMQRVCKGLDRKVVEEGISQTILTLSLKQQQSIMIAWFDRFLKNGDDCPNLQHAFEIWWRRTFVRPQVVDSCASPLRLTSCGDQRA